MYEINWLQEYQQDIIDIPSLQMNQGQFLTESQRNAQDDEEKFHNPAIGFDNVLQHCMDLLEEVFTKKFKKSQMFSEMLMDICKTEAHIRLRRQLKLIPMAEKPKQQQGALSQAEANEVTDTANFNQDN